MNILYTLLVNSLVFSALFGIMLLVRKRFSKKISVTMQYFLWAVILLKLLIPFGFENSLLPARQTSYSPPAIIEQPKQEVSSPVDSNENTEDPNQAEEVVQNQQSSETPENKFPETSERKNINWVGWILAVWILGIAANTSWLIYSYIFMIRQINKSKALVSLDVQNIFESCIKELGIKRKIEIVMQDCFCVPAITGIIKPRLILPSSLNHSSEITIKNVCMHELTHFKYGDLVTIGFLNLINIIYWFHPLVWKSVSLIREDMEAVCDSRVTARLGEQENYVQTILLFATSKSDNKLKAALTMSTGGKVSMEERIKNLFRTKKTGKKAKALVFGLAALMIGTSILTACKPASAVYTNTDIKGSEVLANKNSIPETYKDEFTAHKGITKVNIDAKVDWPSGEIIPSANVQPKGFSQEQVDSVVSAVFGDAPLYQAAEMSKEEVKQILDEQIKIRDEAKKEYEANPDKFGENMNELEIQGYFLRLDADIENCEENYKNASEKVEKKAGSSQFQKSKDFERDMGYDSVEIMGDTKDGLKLLNASSKNETTKFPFGKKTFTSPAGGSIKIGDRTTNRFMMQEYIIPELGDVPSGISISKEQAQKKAVELVDKIGADLKLNYTGVGTDVYKWEKQTWAMVFTREVDGAKTNYTYGEHGDFLEIDQNVYCYEKIVVHIDDNGLKYFEWMNPIEISDVKDTQILPFEEIQKIAKENIEKNIERYYKPGDDTISQNITINSIKLGLTRLEVADGVFELVPVWDFMGYAKSEIKEHSKGNMPKDMERREKIQEKSGIRSVFSLDARTGKLIQREIGK